MVTRGLPQPSVGISATLQFEFASVRLKPESIETLRNLGNALNQELKDEKVFVIEGHTDAVGSRQYNDVLSDRRAEAVKDYLVREMGVLPDRLRIVGKGSSEPADPEHHTRPRTGALSSLISGIDLGCAREATEEAPPRSRRGEGAYAGGVSSSCSPSGGQATRGRPPGMRFSWLPRLVIKASYF